LGGNGKLRSRDLVCDRFVADILDRLVDDDELSFWPGGNAQTFQDGDVLFVGPVMNNFAKQEGGDFLLPRRLRVKEAVALERKHSNVSRANSETVKRKETLMDLGAERGRN